MALRFPVFLGLCLSLSGCATLISEVKPERQDVIGIYEVDAQISWNRRNEYGNAHDGPAMTWTSNGMPIDYLLFFRPVESGQNLVSKVFPGLPFHPFDYLASIKTYPSYESSMDAAQIRQLFVSTLETSRLQDVEVSPARDFDFGGVPGKQSDISFRRDGGAEMKGRIVWTKHDDRLYAIVFAALAVHYYDQLSGPVERLLASLKFNPKSS